MILGSNLSVTASTGSTLTIAGGISESNRGTSLSFGGGELIFSGTDTYTGGTVVSGGTLAVTSAMRCQLLAFSWLAAAAAWYWAMRLARRR